MKRTIYTLIATALLLSCSGHEVRNSIKVLDDVESYIQERPDSALVVLQSINNKALSSKKLKARHGLLLSMAFDKNFIDLTSDSLIAPIVEYYEGTKDYDHLFKAYYYLGRIYHNADRHGFITSTRVTMEMSHPAFFKYLRERELTDWEINYCCLYLIGLKGKDIGDYINLKRHYVYGSAIRRKLGLTENDTNLSLYLQKTLKLM